MRICAQLESDVRFSDTLKYFRKFSVSRDAFQVVLGQLLIGKLDWAHVLSIVALSGSLAVQCAEKGEEKKIDLIQDWAASFAEVKLALWIEANHGMEGLREYLHPQESHDSHWERNKLLSAGGLCCGWRHHYRSLCLGEPGVTQVSASLFCVQSPESAGVGLSPGARAWRRSLYATSTGAAGATNYLCCVRLDVPTYIIVMYVGASAARSRSGPDQS